MILSFNEILVISAVLIFVVVLFCLVKSEGTKQQWIKRLSGFSSFILFVHYLLLSSILLISVYSIYTGTRPWVYFVLEAFVFTSSMLLLLIHNDRPLKFTIIFTLVILAVINSSMPIAENKLVIFSSDQPRGWLGAYFISESGNILMTTAMSGGYYSVIPLFSMLIASISSVTGCSLSLPYLLLPASVGIMMALSAYSILMRLTGDCIASSLAVFIFLSTPRLSVAALTEAGTSLALGSLLILLLLTHVSIHRHATPVAILLLAVTAMCLHPTGIIVMLCFVGGFVILRFITTSKRNFNVNPELITPARVFALIGILSVTYWVFNSVILKSIVGPLRMLYLSISAISFPTEQSVYTPQYYAAGLEVYAFAFAVPVALSVAYVVAHMIFALQSRKKAPSTSKRINSWIMAASLMGLFLIAVAFICVTTSPGASLERYINVPAYLLLIAPSAVVGALLIRQKHIAIFISIMILLVTFMGIGTSSPDWAPFEQQAWGANHWTYTSNMEADTISGFLPQDCYIYNDNDIYLGISATVKGIYFKQDQSYQTIRYKLSGIESGEFQPWEFAYPPITLYIIKTSDVNPMIMGNFQAYIVYSSGRHLILECITDENSTKD